MPVHFQLELRGKSRASATANGLRQEIHYVLPLASDKIDLCCINYPERFIITKIDLLITFSERAVLLAQLKLFLY
jgi:hypothetical protein